MKEITQDSPILMLALDHRQSFLKLINPSNPVNVSREQAIQLKKEIIETLQNYFSGVLIDIEYGLPAYQQVSSSSIPTKNYGREKPYLLPIEKSGAKEITGEKLNEKEYEVAQLKELGASGVKLLLYFNPAGSEETKTHQYNLAAESLLKAQENKLPLFLELVTYGTENQTRVVDSVQMFLERGIKPHVFKLEFPGSLENCAKVTAMLGSTPWIVLTRGDSFAKFSADLKIAVAGGAKGFLAGRALWQEVCSEKDPLKRQEFYTQILVPRFKEIANIVRSGI